MSRPDLPEVLRLLSEFAAYENLSEYCTATEGRFAAALFEKGSVAEGLVCESSDTLVGYAIFYPRFTTFRGELGFYLEDIYISQEYRGGGLGKMLLAEIAKRAAARGFERIDFQVMNRNTPAINFYRSLGAESNDGETHFKFAGGAFQALASGVDHEEKKL